MINKYVYTCNETFGMIPALFLIQYLILTNKHSSLQIVPCTARIEVELKT